MLGCRGLKHLCISTYCICSDKGALICTTRVVLCLWASWCGDPLPTVYYVHSKIMTSIFHSWHFHSPFQKSPTSPIHDAEDVSMATTGVKAGHFTNVYLNSLQKATLAKWAHTHTHTYTHTHTHTHTHSHTHTCPTYTGLFSITIIIIQKSFCV